MHTEGPRPHHEEVGENVVQRAGVMCVELAGGEEAVQRQVVVGGSEPPGHADAWLLSPRLSRRQSAPADECASLVNELLSPQVTRLLVGSLG